jgi:hypothetical protein
MILQRRGTDLRRSSLEGCLCKGAVAWLALLSYGHLSEAVAVTDFDPELSIKVQGRELTVTLPGSNYSVTYFKRHGQFGLLAKEIVNEDDPRLPLTAGQFLAKAWKLANETARELGWIV